MLCISCKIEDRVGEWDCCYECQSEAFAICPRCYRKQYDSHCISHYSDFPTYNIYCEERDFLNCLNFCEECLEFRSQECLEFFSKIDVSLGPKNL